MEYHENSGNWFSECDCSASSTFMASGIEWKTNQLPGCIIYIDNIGMCDGTGYGCSEISVYDNGKDNFIDSDSDRRSGHNCMYHSVFYAS